jgi:hypothetical protein
MAKSVPSVEDMRAHVEKLVARHEILLYTRQVKRTERAYALRATEFPAADEVWTPPIRCVITYATALHEIGHILGRYQESREEMVRERWAWEWARRNAIVWTPQMERCATEALAWIAAHKR